MQDRYYLNNMSNAEVTINLSTRRVIKPFTSLPLNNKDVMIFKEMKAKRKDRISRFDSLKLSRIPLTEDSNFAAKAVLEEAEEIKKAAKEEAKVKVVENPKTEEKSEPKTEEDKSEQKAEDKSESKAEEKSEPKVEEVKPEHKVEENKKSKKEKAEEDARKALEANLNEQYI